MHLCGDATLTTCALPPHPLQRLGERLTAEALRLLLCKLANGEVCLLLAGARSTESYTPDLHDCSTGARTLCLASHLAQYRYRRLGQENLLPTYDSNIIATNVSFCGASHRLATATYS